MNSEITRPDGRKLLIVTAVTIIASIILVIMMQTIFSATSSGEDVVDEDTDADRETGTSEDAHDTIVPEEDITITVSAVGDIMVHDAQLNSMFSNESNDYNFAPAFDAVRDILSDSDITIGNLYGMLAGSENIHSGYPSFNTPDNMATALKDSGFDVIVSANATAMNFGLEGITRHAETMDAAGLETVGINSEPTGSKATYIEVNDILVAFVAYSENVDGYNNQDMSFEEISSRVGVMNETTINEDLAEVRERNPDFIFAYMNWGEEFQYEPTEMQQLYTDLLAENGVDVIVGAYPHNIQQTRYLSSGDDETFVAYSLGNFFSNQRSETLGEGYEPTEDGVIMHFEITKSAGTGDTSLTSVDYTPTWIYRYSENNQVPFDYEILPVQDALDNDDTDEDVAAQLRASLSRTDARLNLAQARNPQVDNDSDNVEPDDSETSDEAENPDVNDTEDAEAETETE